jgi:hypothetical protein
MIIEDIQIDTDVDNGPSLKISGRSLESILDRRIVWKQTQISDKTVEQVIRQLLDENIMAGAGEERCIPNFEYVELPADHYSKTLTIPQIQFTGDNLFDVVKSICDAFGLGFKITTGEPEERDNGITRFYFELLVGEDRSTEQLKNPHVIFSPTFDNLLNSSYLESHKNFKTVTLVAGEGEGSARVMVAVPGDISYTLLTEQPSDWSTNYAKYHTKTDAGFNPVSGVTAAPTWSSNTYYKRVSYGNSNSRYNYVLLTEQPFDWPTKYTDYYIKNINVYERVTSVIVAPPWSSSAYYVRDNNVSVDANVGLARRELFTDARDLTSEKVGSASEYEAALAERGLEKLTEWKVIESFEGSIDPSIEHKYGSLEDVKMGTADYSIGDIVQVENEYGMGARCRVTEFIRSEDSSGSETYPTFTKIQ